MTEAGQRNRDQGISVVRISGAAILRSKTTAVCVVSVLVFGLIGAALVGAWASETHETLRTLYGVAAALPIVGVIIALLQFCRFVLHARTRRLIVGRMITIPATGVSFHRDQLRRIDIWSEQRAGVITTFMTLVPEHIEQRVDAHSLAHGVPAQLRDYCVRLPLGTRPTAYELADNLRESSPALEVNKIGKIA
ncbi:hypothetical protein [Corynebacterium ciconiae]|uniref:hypothetical protein n=1 Tax=Corynebacterium ciconiae TaxID=227319 RepID=UPI00036B5285|nr:hypothetical protein [Corynebacterium ciconiae]